MTDRRPESCVSGCWHWSGVARPKAHHPQGTQPVTEQRQDCDPHMPCQVSVSARPSKHSTYKGGRELGEILKKRD